jgi:hypothetical protein
MVADLRFRNEIADNAKTGMWYEWRLLDPLAKKSLLDIKGRWYETKNLLPTLAGAAKFRQDVALGKLLDANEWMNARLDNNPVPEQRRKNRADTFGQAVPPEFKVSRGLAGDPVDDLFPDQMQVKGSRVNSSSSSSSSMPARYSVKGYNTGDIRIHGVGVEILLACLRMGQAQYNIRIDTRTGPFATRDLARIDEPLSAYPFSL